SEITTTVQCGMQRLLGGDWRHFVGGLVGNNKDGIILGASASGSVTGDNSVGGLVGVNGVIKNTFAVGPVTGNRNVGGLIGLTESGRGSELVESSYFDTQTTGQDTSASPAIGLTTSEMQGDAAIENMPGLEFGEIWRTVSGDYPKLVASSNSDAGGGSESPTSVVEEFDEDGNDNIEITELGQAAQALASGELTFSEFGQIGVEFIM
ncbi:MAG: hypothetical protein J07HQW2_00840, partial [Haloquadratum walsbyi J07HQW2]